MKEFKGKNPKITEDLLKALETAYIDFGIKKFKLTESFASLAAVFEAISAVFKPGPTEDDAKRQMNFEQLNKAKSAFEAARVGDDSADLLEAFNDVLAFDLDAKHGSTVSDQKIFKDLTTFWEADFMQDMKSLNVIPADILTRVTEYIPEIISYVEKIISNGYGYVVEDGSVYFDVQAFHGHNGHHYAKLCPWSAGNAGFLEEGEGALGARLTGKKDPRDFALWKASKAGEPFWPSPWGNGRPGWHIECSAMAGSIMPGVIDVHSGGIDLAFPHHDNEVAQAEAHLECGQWVNYFFHAGHVHIEGHKMSKSLKNFISIKEALQRYTASQLRLMVLLHQWNATVLYRESSMQEAAAYDASLRNFFLNMEAMIREESSKKSETPSNNYGQKEAELVATLTAAQDSVHAALCDSFDTPLVLSTIADLITKTNVYVKADGRPNPEVLRLVNSYVTKIMKVFGVLEQDQNTSGSSTEQSQVLTSVLDVVGAFRDAIRSAARDADFKPSQLLALSDTLRNSLSEHGVVFEDRPGKPTLVKLVDPQQLARQRAEETRKEEEKLARKMQLLAVQEEREREKREKARIVPSEMFKGNPAYSQLDENGVPTHDAAGAELSKNAHKKVVKEYDAQVELHSKYNK